MDGDALSTGGEAFTGLDRTVTVGEPGVQRLVHRPPGGAGDRGQVAAVQCDERVWCVGEPDVVGAAVGGGDGADRFPGA
ncbi:MULTISPECIES: hypothetical protein [unclassified Frankia]|uniref:hypothetical protein n=1 Tax=unclassified Frankia TaxID=2632575 RepID=UPI002AD5102E|nr:MULTISPECIES: hypothetical protein [unclassified Frankia]